MKYNFKELVDISKLQELTDELYIAASIPSAIVSMDGEVLTGSGWQRICTDFHRQHPECKKDCFESDIKIRKQLNKGESFAIYKCPRGLVDASSPVIIAGEHVANIFSGQLFLKPPDETTEQFFREQARKFGFDETEYIRAFKEIPVFTEKEFRSALAFLAKLAQIIADMGLTQLKELESVEELLDSKERFKTLSTLTFEGILTHNNGVIIDSNRAVTKMIGYAREELIGENIIQLCVPQEYHATIKENIVKGFAKPYEVMVRRKDGTLFPAEIEAKDIKKKNKIFRVAAIRDITELRQAAEILRESEEKYRQLFELESDAIFLIEKETGKILEVNTSATKIYGFSREELLTMKNIDLSAEPEKTKEATRDQLNLIPIRYHRKKDGSIFPVEITASHLNWQERESHIAAIRDISFRVKTEMERAKLEKELYQARKLESIGTLAGGIAHDFNNLLYVVLGNISLAQDDLKPEMGTSESLKAAKDACIKAKELTARLITFSKGGDPVKKMISIGDLLKNTVVSSLQGSNIKPEISIANDIRQANIDEDQIKQVVRDIAVNAKEAMDGNGQLKVSCKNIEISKKGYLTLSPGKYIKISFKDQGCGISKENLNKIFDPYFSTKDMGANKGQGLGLTISYSIIEKHGGLITVESELRTGSIVSVYLPAASAKEPGLQKPEEKSVAKEHVKQAGTGTGKILLMDDEEEIRTFLGQVINRLGYDVECTEGKEAVEIYKKAMESKEAFDVAILDLTNKVGMGGQETMRRLLEIDPDVKGIIITGYSDAPVVTNFRAYGFAGFITKPATRDRLSKVINEVISKDQ